MRNPFPRVRLRSAVAQYRSTSTSSKVEVNNSRGPLKPAPTFYDKTVEAFARRTPRKISIMDTFSWKPDNLIDSARLLQDELPIRISKTVRNFQNLPFIVGQNPHINRLYTSLWDTLQELGSHPPIRTLEDEKSYTRKLDRHFRETEGGILLLGWGIKEVRQLPVSMGIDYDYIDLFIDQFLSERLGRRILAEQHIGLHQPKKNYNGIFCTKCQPLKSLKNVISIVEELCEDQYGQSPKFIIDGCKEDVTFTYIPSHLEYILLEVLKNSARATMDDFVGLRQKNGQSQTAKGRPQSKNPYPINVTVGMAHDDSHVHIIIKDQGGGIPHEKLQGANSVWSYGYTTIRGQLPKYDDNVDITKEEDRIAKQYQLAGWGFGLPMSRLYVRCLGGDMALFSVSGYGTTVYLSLPNLGKKIHTILL